MKTIIHFTAIILIFLGSFYCHSNAHASLLPLSGKWTGMFMDQFNLELHFSDTVNSHLSGRIILFDGPNQIQNDELINIHVEGSHISFSIPAKETLFEGTINDKNMEIAGEFIFSDGNRHPLLVSFKEKNSIDQAENETSLSKNKEYSEDQLNQDYEKMIQEIMDNHPRPFQYTDQNEFENIVNSIGMQFDKPMTRIEFFKLLSMVVAKIRCSHTGIRLGADFEQGIKAEEKYFPLKLYFSDDRAWIVSGIIENQEIEPGSELISINHVPLKNIIEVIFSMIPAEGFNQTTKYYVINNQFETYYRLLSSTNTFDIEFINPTNNERSVSTIAGVNYDNTVKSVKRTEHENSPFHVTYLKENNTALWKIPSFSYDDINEYLKETERLFAKLMNEKTENLILDLRGNNGGHPIFAAILYSYLTQEPFIYFNNQGIKIEEFEPLYNTMEANEKAFSGNLYVWIDGGCLSTTGHFISLLRYQDKAIFIGEEPGSWFSCNDNSVKRKLPNTGIELNIPRTTFETAVSGFESGDVFMVDYPVIISVDDKLDNKDIYLNKTLEIISNPSNTL